jgi:Domain of unknown function (DUF4396)
MPPEWLEPLATAFLALAFLSATVTVAMLVARPQRMPVMDVVWPVTALYWGPVGVWGLWDMGAPPASPAKRRAQQPGAVEAAERAGGRQGGDRMQPRWRQVAVAVCHCGAGCTLGDIVGEWLVYANHWHWLGDKVYAEFLVDFPIAFGLGIIFQYFTIAPMKGLGLRDGLLAAVKADAISIAAFEIGLFGWMALDAFVLFPGQSIATWNHWFQMQIGMIVGFFTSYPANLLLLRRGLKEPM